jgi:hypothetical protein
MLSVSIQPFYAERHLSMSNDIILNVIVPNGIILSAIMPCHDTEFYFAKWHRVIVLNA